jgi:hypothetical protein
LEDVATDLLDDDLAAVGSLARRRRRARRRERESRDQKAPPHPRSIQSAGSISQGYARDVAEALIFGRSRITFGSPLDRSFVRILSFASVAILALVSARLVSHDARYAIVLVFVAIAFAVPTWLARRRMRRIMIEGDVGRVLSAFERSLDAAPHPETTAPLMNATAYAAYGFIDEARRAMGRAARGPAWEAALEQRLFVEALLDVYEGERQRAIAKAEALQQLPLPTASFWMRRKVSVLRRGVLALARAFAHSSRPDDVSVLEHAAQSSPLVYWAMRYARAIVLVDRGRREDARAAIADAPDWPQASAFRTFHDELLAQMG